MDSVRSSGFLPHLVSTSEAHAEARGVVWLSCFWKWLLPLTSQNRDYSYLLHFLWDSKFHSRETPSCPFLSNMGICKKPHVMPLEKCSAVKVNAATALCCWLGEQVSQAALS